MRPNRREQIERDGLVIESPNGNARIAAKTVTAEDLKPGYDVVLFTCKAYDLDSAMDAVAPAMDGKAALLPQLNGIATSSGSTRVSGRATCGVVAKSK